MHPMGHVNLGGHMHPKDHVHPGDHVHPEGHVHPSALIPARHRGSMLTIIGTHLDSVYSTKIRFEANGVRTKATVSTGKGGCYPLALPAPSVGTVLCQCQHPPARRSVRARGHRSSCCAAAQPSPLRPRWRRRWGT